MNNECMSISKVRNEQIFGKINADFGMATVFKQKLLPGFLCSNGSCKITN